MYVEETLVSVFPRDRPNGPHFVGFMLDTCGDINRSRQTSFCQILKKILNASTAQMILPEEVTDFMYNSFVSTSFKRTV